MIPFRYDLTSRPRVGPGAVVRCGWCEGSHRLLPDPAAPTPGLLYYHCAGANGRGPAATTRSLGALAGWLLDGLAPLPEDDDAPPPPPPGPHTHLCPGCARPWSHPEPACRPRGMIPKRCPACVRQRAATLARWAHITPDHEPSPPAAFPDPPRRRRGAARRRPGLRPGRTSRCP